MSLNVELLEQSFERIKPCAEEFVASFYENLFIAHPEVKPLFAKIDIVTQQKKLLNALVLVVENLRNPEALGPVLSALGGRHVGYGATAKYYGPIGEALLSTFEQYLQADWTPEVKQAWVDAYRAITALMLKGAGVNSAPEEVQLKTSATPEKQVAKAPATPTHHQLESVPDIEPKELPVELLESSFEKVKPRAEEFVASFYENLFIAHPEVKPLFAKIDIVTQQKKLLNALVLVVENLRNPEALGPVLSALGGRHVGYGATAKYYGPIGEALLTTFEQYLQEDWTVEVKQAWVDAYREITSLMLKGAGLNSAPEAVQLKTSVTPEKQVAKAPATLTQHQLESVSNSEPKELPVELLTSSFEKVKPRAEEFVASFYENLFIAHPEVKPLFAKIDIVTQQKKLLNALVLVVENLRNPEALGSVLNALGGRHVGYGATAKYYGPVGEALLTTFEQYLQEDWTPEVKQAWVDAFRAITSLMLKGAGEESSPIVVRDEKLATIQKPSELKPELLHESKPLPPQAEPQKKPLISIQLDGDILKEILDKITDTYKKFQPQLSDGRWWEFLKQTQDKLIDTFWAQPVWVVATISAVIMSVVFVLTDDNSLLGEVLGGADTISLVVALVLFIKEAPDRRKQFHYQAWSTIDAAHGVKVSYARILALQDLNEDGVSLRGLDTPGAELVDIHLPKANLSAANLSETDLSNANLSHANLDNANLSQAKLSAANLSHAKLSFARLHQSNLSSANLSSANLICADLSQANLSGVNLKNASLSGANLAGTYLTGANLKDAKVSLYELSSAFLEGAILPDGSKHQSLKG